jgi:hypothetical protein
MVHVALVVPAEQVHIDRGFDRVVVVPAEEVAKSVRWSRSTA